MTRTFHRMPAHRLPALAMAALLVVVGCSSSAASALPTINTSALPGASSSPAVPSPATSAAASPAGSAVVPGASAAAGSPAAAGACPTSQPAPMPAGQTATVTINTNQGAIVVKVEGALGPNAAGNFVALAKCGYFNGVVFHRVVPGFVIQGGDGQYGKVPNVGLDVGNGGPGYSFPDDPVTVPYIRGTVAMANAGANTNGSQFFICLSNVSDPPYSLSPNYSVFGHVTSGMDAVDKIAALPTDGDANGNHPLQSVPMTSVTVTTP